MTDAPARRRRVRRARSAEAAPEVAPSSAPAAPPAEPAPVAAPALAVAPASGAACLWCARAPGLAEHGGHCTAEHAARWEDAAATLAERDAAEYLTGQRTPEALVASSLGLSAAAWQRLRRSDAALRDALARGRAREHKALVDSLFAEATEGAGPSSVAAATFLLKCRHGYVDKVESEPARVRVEVRLPAALSPDQYAQLRSVVTGRPALVDVTPRAARQLGPGDGGAA